MALKEFKKAYEKVQNDLPSFEDLDKNFGLAPVWESKGEDIEGEILAPIRHRMVDVFTAWVNYLHGVYIPNPGFFPALKMHEALSDDDKHLIFHVISKLNLLIQKSYKVSLNWDSSKDDVDYIKETFKEFIKIKKDINTLIDSNIDCWDNIIKNSQ